ncbi:FGGY-family carbohydrate kinase [Salinigranum salinum]|uniref:FGGY-family carbohydrate kinase n=1 Tax=Salinigranum salinum TaxID=1364937 RepID=UPI0012612C00|nr:FGGY-family carbohydrate kinase [Salinigranum salinum]
MGDDANTADDASDEPLLLGVDAGLTNVKAAVFDADGRELTVASRASPNVDAGPERVERDMDEFWAVTCDVVREAVASDGVGGDRIAGVGVAGHGHGLYALDSEGEPVRPGITSLDSRATSVVDAWDEAGLTAAVAERIGYEPFVADPLSLLGWLQREEPDAYDAIDRLLFCKDYLKYRLTDVVCTDETEASVFFDPDREAYSAEAFELLGLDDCLEALPAIVPSWEACGEVTPAAAAETGLDAGTPVASGLHDVGAVALGAGAHRPGQGTLIVGTWGQSISLTADPGGHEAAGIARRFLRDGWLRYRGTRSAAAAVDWFVDECCPDWREDAEARGVDPYRDVNERVADVPAGANGLLFLPYLRGSTDHPNARGGFVGLTEDHTRPAMVRAIYEGVALSLSTHLQELAGDRGLSDVRLGGGGAKSTVWSQLFADVLGEDVVVPAGAEMGARGVAICAGLAVGLYDDHADAVDRTVSTERRHRPDPARVASYRTIREAFETTVEQHVTIWETLKQIGREGKTNGDH